MLRPVALALALALALVPAVAVAADDDAVAGGATLLVGPGYWAEDGPARLRLSIRGEAALATSDAVGLGLVIPLDIASSARDGFGWSTERMLVELAPSARLRIAPMSVVRAYLDVGAGPWISVRRTSTIFGSAEQQRVGALTTAAVGFELGPTEAESLAFVVEPIRARTYFTDGDDRVRADYSAMVGIGVRF